MVNELKLDIKTRRFIVFKCISFCYKKLRKVSYSTQCIVLKKVLFGAFIILGICDFFVKSIIYDFWPQPFYASLKWVQ